MASRRNVPKKPSSVPYVNPKSSGAPGKLKPAGSSAKAYTPRATGVLPTGVAFPGGSKPALEDIWRGSGLPPKPVER